MAIVERDPWRMQYFQNVVCPENVFIPTEDSDAYLLYPRYRWVYNKLAVAESQGLPCGLHGIEPSQGYPIFSKPVYNMRGMGEGSRILRSHKEYARHQRPGHFWMPLLEGEHVSTDVAVVAGEPKWWRHVAGKPLGKGKFDYWTILAQSRPEIEIYGTEWLRKHLAGYTGMVNLETIGGRIIEVHLRFADQWPDLYGAGWLDALVRLYSQKDWRYHDDALREGFSVVLFGAHRVVYRHPKQALIETLLRRSEISSIQITFHKGKPARAHAMPLGGFRLAVVNCWTLAAGFAARAELALAFASAPELIARRGSRKRGLDAPTKILSRDERRQSGHHAPRV